MRMNLIAFIGLILSTPTFAFSLNCTVENYEVSSQEAQYAVANKFKSITIKKVTGLSQMETEIGCSNRDLNSEVLRIEANTGSEVIDITQCETQDHYSEIDGDITYTNFNDHDAPEERLALLKITDQYFKGILVSKWDATEVLTLKCQKYQNNQ